MITHKSFIEHLTKIFNKAMLEKDTKLFSIALQTLEFGIEQIKIHTLNTVTKPPQLLRLEREIFREAYELTKTKARA